MIFRENKKNKFQFPIFCFNFQLKNWNVSISNQKNLIVSISNFLFQFPKKKKKVSISNKKKNVSISNAGQYSLNESQNSEIFHAFVLLTGGKRHVVLQYLFPLLCKVFKWNLITSFLFANVIAKRFEALVRERRRQRGDDDDDKGNDVSSLRTANKS